jgi:hypothetical protein
VLLSLLLLVPGHLVRLKACNAQERIESYSEYILEVIYMKV